MPKCSKYKVIGKNVPRVDALAKARGSAAFSDDVHFQNMVYGKVLHSPHAHAKILRLDVEKARALRGVRAVLTAADLPCNRSIGEEAGWILAEDEVCYLGDKVAVVAADTEEIAREALALIEVEYEILPAVTRLEDTQREDCPLANTRYESNLSTDIHSSHGDVQAQFDRADLVVSGAYHFPYIHQAHLEPNAAAATYIDGELTVYCASQVWFRLRADLASRCGLPESRVRVKPQHVGGAFGARNEQTIPVLAALLAIQTGRPAKITQTREEEFYAAHPAVEMTVEISMAFDKEGHFLARRTRYTGDVGAFAVAGGWVIGVACFRSDAAYQFKAVEVTGHGMRTNRPPTAAYRGYGNPQAHFALECTIDIGAERLGIDPAEIRMRNYTEPDTVAINGYRISSVAVKDCMRRAMELADWHNKRADRTVDRGIGVASLIHAAGSRAGEPEFSGDSAMVRCEMSGRITVLAGESEIGQGCKTVMAQIAAEEFGVDANDIAVVMGDTDLAPFNTGTHGSKLTTILGNAVLFACRDAKRQILDAARDLTGSGELWMKEGNIVNGRGDVVLTLEEALRQGCIRRSGLPFVGMGIYEPDAVMLDERGYGNLAPTYPFGVQMVEISVNRRTGRITVEKIISVHDSGVVINPQMAWGQVYGGTVQALGFAVMEQMGENDQGLLESGTLLEYKMPTTLETPDFAVDFVQQVDPHGPYGAKSLGEPPIISILPAIANAFYMATGIRLYDAPFTPRRMKEAIKEHERAKEESQ